MATLNEAMKETADAIREKTGKSDPIAPINFAEEIKSIPTGGGDTPSGGIKMIYLNLSAVGGVSVGMAKASFGILNGLAKVDNTIAPAASLSSTITSLVRAAAVPLGMRTFVDGEENDITVTEDALNEFFGEEWQDWEITEAEFYDLNA